MKFTAVLVALTSVTYVMAGNCKTGLSYCGRSLLNIGKYVDQIMDAIEEAQSNPAHMLDTLFFCAGGPNGDIRVIKDCGNSLCADAGPGKSDMCVAASRIHLTLEVAEGEFAVERDQKHMCG